MKKFTLFSFLVLLNFTCFSQELFEDRTFTRADTLRGSITSERIWWDLQHYDLSLKINSSKKTISGKNIITYVVLEPYNVMQIDLQMPLKINRIVQNGQTLEFIRDGNAHFIQLKEEQKKGATYLLEIEFSGKPIEAENAPWDGGITWGKDAQKRPFIASSCQGIGASTWWPCKDHLYDEPDRGMIIRATVPEELTAVSNGRLISETVSETHFKAYTWEVKNPINNYAVSLYVGHYVHFSEKYEGENGTLDMDYWVLDYNLEKAKKQFADARRCMQAFEHWFGPYPFYEDSYKLVEAPFLGMEHQSAVAYGNNFSNGYLGRDRSGTGWGLKWDFIIVHETGHEWFGNNITNKDVADMWIHEGFTTYSEALFLEYFYGKEAGAEYIHGLQADIENKKPLIGTYDLNAEGPADIYNKGANVLHTLRQWVNNDSLWLAMLRGMNEEFYHQTVTTAQIENYMAEKLQLNLDAFFDQYLRDQRPPFLAYKLNGPKLEYQWAGCVEGFNMPLEISVNDVVFKLYPTTTLQVLELGIVADEILIDPDYYIFTYNKTEGR